MKLILKLPVLILFPILLGCGGNTGSDSPANAVKDFVAALKEHNHEKAWNHLSGNSKEMYERFGSSRNQSGREYFENSVTDIKSLGTIGMDFEVIEENKSGDSAIVIIKTISNGQTAELFTVKENSVWKLDYARSIEESIKSEDQ
jgi:limonene-1,2-epoxide hydrolase